MWAESFVAELTDPGRIRLPGKQRHTRRFLFIRSNYELVDEFVRLGSKGLSVGAQSQKRSVRKEKAVGKVGVTLAPRSDPCCACSVAWL